MKESTFPDWLEKAAKTILDECSKECDEKRKFMLPIWKRAEYYWNDVQDLFWNRMAEDWYTYDEEAGEDEIDAIKDANKIINIYRALGESIIAAATVGNLSIRFFPENADDPADLDKSRSFSDKSDYIQRKNNIRELRREALRIRWTQGLVGAYTYFKRDKAKYGTFKKDIISKRSVLNVSRTCPECGYNEENQYEDPNEIANAALPVPCPECNQSEQIPPEMMGMEDPSMAPPPPINMESIETMEEIPFVDGQEEVVRGCSVIELYDPLHLKVPAYVKKAADIPYVIVETDIHYAIARALYPKFADKINPGNTSTESHDRTQADHFYSIPSRNLVTLTRMWVKPEMYNLISDEGMATAKMLLKKYPNGKFATFINNEVMVACEDIDFDECWQFADSAMDTHIYHRAMGNAVIPIQDLTNDMVFITIDTIRHAIGETFVDDRVIDLNRYREGQTKPGSIYPIENKGGKSISDYFYSTKNASLSREVDTFMDRLMTWGQLVSGAFPSIYGGMLDEGSKTLGVYQESRQQALQRVAMGINSVDDMMSRIIYKATEVYDKNMEDEENYAIEHGSGFKNVTMRKAAPGAKIGRVETVQSEQFPTTWEQKRAFIMELIGQNNEAINSTIFSSENIGLMSKIIGIPELKVPGEADRDKQLHEIQELLQAEPVPVEGQIIEEGQQPQMQSTVAVDSQVDNNSIHIGAIVSWAISPEGIRTKKENPGGYANVMAHLDEHMLLASEQEAQNPPAEEEGKEKESSDGAAGE